MASAISSTEWAELLFSLRKFIILACDGLWDVLSNKKAISFVLKLLPHVNKLNIAKLLAEYAIKIGSMDNVTIIILFL